MSKVDKSFAKLLKQHKAIQAQAYVARVHLAPDFAYELKRKISKVEEDWEVQYQHTRASQETLKQALGEIAWHATLGRQL